MLIIFSASAEVIVESVNVHPSGDLKSGEKNVSVDFQIDLISVSGVTFPNDWNIVLSTQLENPIWYYAIVLDGIDNEKTSFRKNRLTLTGWLLSYNDREEQVKVILRGDSPIVSTPKLIEVVNIKITSGSGKVIEQVKNISALVTNSEEDTGVKKSESLNVRKSQSGIVNGEITGLDASDEVQSLRYMPGIFVVISILIFVIMIIIWNKSGNKKNYESICNQKYVDLNNICQNCGKGNEIGTKFCRECGLPLIDEKNSKFCMGCGEILEPDVRFCPRCGKQHRP